MITLLFKKEERFQVNFTTLFISEIEVVYKCKISLIGYEFEPHMNLFNEQVTRDRSERSSDDVTA